MARLAITPIVPVGGYPTLPLPAGAATVTFTPAGAAFVDGASFPLTGREVLLVRNPTAGALTVTVSSTADAQKRLGDITGYSVAPSAVAVLGPFPTTGWRQSNGNLYFAASAATLEFAVLRLP